MFRIKPLWREKKNKTHSHTHTVQPGWLFLHSTFYNSGINHCHGLRPVSNWSGDFILQPENHGWLPVPLLPCPGPSLSSCSCTSCILLQAQEPLKSTKTMNEDNRVSADPPPHCDNWIFVHIYVLLQHQLILFMRLQCLLAYLKHTLSPKAGKNKPAHPSPI